MVGPNLFTVSSNSMHHNIALEPSAQVLVSRVSNGTGFSCPSGQRDRSLFIVPRQRDNGTEGRGPWNADGCRHKGGRGQISGKIC